MKKRIVALILAFSVLATPLSVSSRGSDTWISETAQQACVEYGERYGICPELLEAVIETESSGQPNVQNGGCKGLAQIYEKYHRGRMKRLGVSDIYDERGNVLVAADYLAELFEEYGEASLVLDVYNGNSKAQYNYENGIMSEYAGKILERSAELERIHRK